MPLPLGGGDGPFFLVRRTEKQERITFFASRTENHLVKTTHNWYTEPITGGISMKMRLRRNQNYLVMIGTGVIILGFWSVIKTVMFLILEPQDITGFSSTVQVSGMPIHTSYLILVVLLGIELAVRLFVGLSARSEGFGSRQRPVYVVFAILLSLFHLAAIVASIGSGFRFYDNPMDAAVSLLMDLTSLVTLVELVNSVFKVRWLSRELSLSE
jgi:NADH:ubiquinone oxidoreductase subunit 6 (subunit J)